MIARFLGQLLRRQRSGQTTVEFSLAFLLVATVIFGSIEVSRAVYAKHSVARAAEIVANELAQLAKPGQIDACAAQLAVQDSEKQTGLGLNSSDYVTHSTTTCPSVAALPNGKDMPMSVAIANGTVGTSGACQAQASGTPACQTLQSQSGDITVTGFPDLNAPTSVTVIMRQQYKSQSRLFSFFAGGTVQETVTALTQAGQ